MIVRSLLLLLPLSLWAWFIIQPRWTSRDITATFLGFVWSFHASLVISILFVSNSTLVFPVDDTLFYGVPLDWIIAQSVIMGALVPLTRLWGWHTGLRLLLQATVIAISYWSVMIVFDEWLFTGVVLLMTIVAAIPAMLLSDWTAMDRHIGKRATLQAVAWAALLFWLFPSLIFYLTADDWSVFLQRNVIITGLYLFPLLLPAYLLINALYHFAIEGQGTAFPYDPPKRLVTQGVYQYISNPMQVGISFAMGWWGIVIQSLWVSISAIIAIVLFVVFKDVCNGSCAIGLNNPEWEAYQRTVPKWWPRLRRNMFPGK